MTFITAPQVSAGAQLLGAATGLAGAAGVFGSQEGPDRDFWGRYWRDFTSRERELEFARNLQKDYFNLNESLISRRVEDAKRAGVHPLYALGVSGVSAGAGAGGWSLPQPQTGSYYRDSTTKAGILMDALDRIERYGERRAAAETRKTEAEASMMESAAARAAQPGVVPGVTEVAEPFVPSRPMWEQLMRTHGPVNMPEWDDQMAGRVAGVIRDVARELDPNKKTISPGGARVIVRRHFGRRFRTGGYRPVGTRTRGSGRGIPEYLR